MAGPDHTKKPREEKRATRLTTEVEERLLREYNESKRRLLLLDYDGTLVPFFGNPEDAQPEDDLFQLLGALAADPHNTVVILSGRDQHTLDTWFHHLDLSLVAEHGVWIKEKKWEIIEPLKKEWKDEIRPILELYMNRTPGAFIEEKEFSLVWHYRETDPELSTGLVKKLTDELVNLTPNLNLQILEGNKVVEVKNSGIDKGRAAVRWIGQKKWNFILAIGDDRTDEDTFGVLPEYAYSLKVGLGSSCARFNLESQAAVLPLLKKLASSRVR